MSCVSLGMNNWVLWEEIKLMKIRVFVEVFTQPQLRYLAIIPLVWTVWKTTLCPEQPLMKSAELWISTFLWTSPSMPPCIGRILQAMGCEWSHTYFDKNFHCEKQNAQGNKGDHFIQPIATESMSLTRNISKKRKGLLGLTEASKQENQPGSYESHEDEWRWVFSKSLRKDEGESSLRVCGSRVVLDG